MIALRFSNIHT